MQATGAAIEHWVRGKKHAAGKIWFLLLSMVWVCNSWPSLKPELWSWMVDVMMEECVCIFIFLLHGDRKTSSLWLALWLLRLLSFFSIDFLQTMLYIIQGQELRDTGDDLMAVNADETQPDLAGMGVRGITEWEWNSVEWGNFVSFELLLLQIRHWKVFTMFINFWHRCIMLIIQIHLVFSDRSKVSRLLFIFPCQGKQSIGRIPSWPDPLGVPWVHGLGTKEVGHHVLVKSHDPGREDPAVRTQWETGWGNW